MQSALMVVVSNAVPEVVRTATQSIMWNSPYRHMWFLQVSVAGSCQTGELAA